MTEISSDDYYACMEALYSFCEGPCDKCPFRIGICIADFIASVLDEHVNEVEEA
jgi:hypothetical protein